MPTSPPTLVVDFDGTLALHDVGDLLCDRFGDASWREIARSWRDGKLSLPEAQRLMWATVRTTPEDLASAALELGELRAGADELFAAAAAGALRLVIASGGFETYIRPILGERLRHVHRLYASELHPTMDGTGITFRHPELSAGPYAICKAKAVEATDATAFCGDGSSDRSVVQTNVQLFVVRGSLLERSCNDVGRERIPFDDFRTVLDAVL